MLCYQTVAEMLTVVLILVVVEAVAHLIWFCIGIGYDDGDGGGGCGALL